ncbi:MAG TPA: S26 family signal peptidase [Micromonosporaceae bacterium]
MIWLGLLAALAVLFAGALVLRLRFVAVQVEGVSMEPTFHGGQWVLVRRTSVSRLRRGQVVVVALRPESEPPIEVGDPPWMIKRVAALPGDPVPRVEVPALTHVPEPTVPADRLVLLGDNPAASHDSRRHGYFDADTLLGVVVRVLRR